MGWRGFGFVHHSRTVFCRAVPNPNLTIRNFCIAVPQRRHRRVQPPAQPPKVDLYRSDETRLSTLEGQEQFWICPSFNSPSRSRSAKPESHDSHLFDRRMGEGVREGGYERTDEEGRSSPRGCLGLLLVVLWRCARYSEHPRGRRRRAKPRSVTIRFADFFSTLFL